MMSNGDWPDRPLCPSPMPTQTVRQEALITISAACSDTEGLVRRPGPGAGQIESFASSAAIVITSESERYYRKLQALEQ